MGPDTKPRFRKVVWHRYASARALVRRGVQIGAVPPGEAAWLTKEAKAKGMHAFTAIGCEPAHVFYWVAPGTTPRTVAFLLGHELGHATGRPLKSRRNYWREEDRADEYGGVAEAVLSHVLWSHL